jgi:hypothetical protein
MSTVVMPREGVASSIPPAARNNIGLAEYWITRLRG